MIELLRRAVFEPRKGERLQPRRDELIIDLLLDPLLLIRDTVGVAFSLLMVVGEVAGDALDRITGHSPEQELAQIRHDLGLDQWTDGTT